MRFVAPLRENVDRRVFEHPVFADFARWHPWCSADDWPGIEAFNIEFERHALALRCVEQEASPFPDGDHYETRIAHRGQLSTRTRNWHDLFNAMVWLRWPAMKRAMNARQVADIDKVGQKQRTRAQHALTHFDEAGVVLVLRDARRLAAWDMHDWVGLFDGLQPGDFRLVVVGHALLEIALDPTRLLVGKALAVVDADPHRSAERIVDVLARRVAAAQLLLDPQELRPLPLMGLPGWHPQAGDVDFVRSAPCFQPRRVGRRYPPEIALVLDERPECDEGTSCRTA
ncbi:MAG TPA: DUF3025 domain-containing protein [Arenimonas sp.]|nr:DUF3025 domain-containing protein [Arenimonas sp.]